MRHETPDWLDDVMAQTPQWEPPAGFALRVTATARQHHTVPPEPRVQRERLLLASWWRMSLAEALKARTQNTLWVLRQYLGLLGR